LAKESAQRGSLAEIKHVVLLMQENRSFNHYFGTLSGQFHRMRAECLRWRDMVQQICLNQLFRTPIKKYRRRREVATITFTTVTARPLRSLMTHELGNPRMVSRLIEPYKDIENGCD
jgi:hypothetical protein